MALILLTRFMRFTIILCTTNGFYHLGGFIRTSVITPCQYNCNTLLNKSVLPMSAFIVIPILKAWFNLLIQLCLAQIHDPFHLRLLIPPKFP